jgi:predicted dehydrogenase
MILTYRYLDRMRTFLDEAAAFDAYGGRAAFFGNGSLPGTYFGTPWRLTEGALLDLGPHVLDALDAALGPIEAVEAHGDPLRMVLLSCAHAGGRVSQAALCATTTRPGGMSVELLGLEPGPSLDLVNQGPGQAERETAVARGRIVADLVAGVREGRPHPLDVHRGVHLQRLIGEAAAQLG